jgi:hypothetical protein
MALHKTIEKVRKFEECKMEQLEEAAYRSQEDRHNRMRKRDQRLRHMRSIETKRIKALREK